MRKLVIIVLIVFVSQAHAADFGAVLSIQTGIGHSDEFTFGGKVTLAPWLSLTFDTFDIYTSAGLSADYKDDFSFFPELFQLEYSTILFNSLYLRAGRISFTDTSRFTAKGFFDGADVLYSFGKIQLGASAFYTGLLYKDTANINVSPADTKNYEAKDSYFAPGRILTSVYGEFFNFPNERGNFHAGLMAQFDLSSDFHTQYLLLRYNMVYKAFDISASGAAQLGDTKMAYAVSVEGGMQLPTPLTDRLSLGFRWASGGGPSISAFFPVIREAQGLILKPCFSGIMVISANYEARIRPTLSVEAGTRYFLRTDAITFKDPDIENDSYTLGAEIAVSVLFVPFSDLSLSMTTGVFLPQLGGAMRDGASARWAVSLGAIFSF